MEEKFYEYLNKDTTINKASFENNWPYILQATRNGLMVVERNESIIYYTKRIKNKPTSPNVIVHCLGPYKKELILSFVKTEKDKGIATIVKNVDLKEKEWWLSQGFYENTIPWSAYSMRDDNTYPQYNVSHSTVKHMSFGKDIQQQIRHFTKTTNIVTEPYSEIYNTEAMKLLETFGQYSENKGNDFSNEVIAGHMFFFDTQIKNKIRLQHIQNGSLIGFSFLTPVGNIAFYNAVICRHERNLMKYLVYQSMNFIISNYPNITLFGMQGSENSGQNNLKLRLKPSESIHKTHMVL